MKNSCYSNVGIKSTIRIWLSWFSMWYRIDHHSSRTFDIGTRRLQNYSKFFAEDFLPYKMVFLKLALVDPDFVLPWSPVAATLPSFYRVESYFESWQTINAIFLDTSETALCDQLMSNDRGLHQTIFRGKDRYSGNTISVTVQNSSASWDEVINEFDPLFNVTFKLDPKHRFDIVAVTPVNVPNFPLFSSIFKMLCYSFKMMKEAIVCHCCVLNRAVFGNLEYLDTNLSLRSSGRPSYNDFSCIIKFVSHRPSSLTRTTISKFSFRTCVFCWEIWIKDGI